MSAGVLRHQTSQEEESPCICPRGLAKVAANERPVRRVWFLEQECFGSGNTSRTCHEITNETCPNDIERWCTNCHDQFDELSKLLPDCRSVFTFRKRTEGSRNELAILNATLGRRTFAVEGEERTDLEVSQREILGPGWPIRGLVRFSVRLGLCLEPLRSNRS